jgi:inorganic pyrophosphatase
MLEPNKWVKVKEFAGKDKAEKILQDSVKWF